MLSTKGTTANKSSLVWRFRTLKINKEGKYKWFLARKGLSQAMPWRITAGGYPRSEGQDNVGGGWGSLPHFPLSTLVQVFTFSCTPGKWLIPSPGGKR